VSIDARSLDARRRMLADWYLGAARRYAHVFCTERQRHVVRVGGTSYYVTSQHLQDALDATYAELHVALGRRSGWGVGKDGKPTALAVAGLAQRRLRSRLVDELRRNERAVVISDDASADDTIADDGLRGELSAVLDELAREPAETRAAVLLTAAGYRAPEIGEHLGIAPASVRQRTSRFARRIRVDETATAA